MKKFFSKFDATFEQPQANFIGKVFNIGRQTVTVDEMIAEGESIFPKITRPSISIFKSLKNQRHALELTHFWKIQEISGYGAW